MEISVLVVDDSAFMRRAITRMLEGEPDIVVSATARTGEEALEKAMQLNPDVITMDVEMPGMGGLEAVRAIRSRSNIPIIMVSSLTQEGAETTFLALDAGAVDVIPKPDAAYVNMSDVARDLVAKVRVFARRGVRKRRPVIQPRPPAVELPPLPEPRGRAFECLAIGSSTGGPVALAKIVPALPASFPVPIVIVQHMPPGFTRPLAERLNRTSELHVREGEEGMPLRRGEVIVAPAGLHLRLRKSGDGVCVVLQQDDGRSLHTPSVDVTAASVAEIFGAGTLATILTGMGHDGVVGLREVKDRGGFVVGQDAASSVVYGMPRAAFQAGLVDRVVPLNDIAAVLCELNNTAFARS